MASPVEEPTAPSAASSESESRQSNTASAGAGNVPGSSNSRKRASRAGTRSVSTLSQAQLERKRANDREAQRAIRARTKEHIEKLERKIAELSNLDGRNEQLLSALKRNKELEEENQMLRATLDQQNYALSGVPESPASAWQGVPHLKTPVPGQPLRLSTQQDMRSSVGSPSSAVPRTDSAGFTQPSQWQSGSSTFGSPMSSRGNFGPPLRSADSQQDPNQQWRYPQRRSQTTPLQEDYKTAPQNQMPQQMDYSYMSGSSESQAASRNNSQPSIFQNNPQAHDQHMRHLSEQLGLSPVEMGGYGQLPQQQSQSPNNPRPIINQNQQQQPQHQNQQQQAPPTPQQSRHQQSQPQPQLPSQSPSQYQPQPPGRLKPSPTDNTAHNQQMFYGPYSSR